MVTAEYLRGQAEACVRIARACFDLTAAERLRHLAAELRAKADDIDPSHASGASTWMNSPISRGNTPQNKPDR
jgi:hypothetical protein